MRLEHGGVYYMEALMKEDVGGGVSRPRSRLPKIIPRRDLYVKPPSMMIRHFVES